MCLQVVKIDTTRNPLLYYLADLQGDKKSGSYYKEQLTVSPQPGIDFKFEVKFFHYYPPKMTLVIYFDMDCLANCEEWVFVLKCFTVAFLVLIVGLGFKLLKLV